MHDNIKFYRKHVQKLAVNKSNLVFFGTKLESRTPPWRMNFEPQRLDHGYACWISGALLTWP